MSGTTRDRGSLSQPDLKAIARRAILAVAVLLTHGCVPLSRDCRRVDVHCAGVVTGFGAVDEGIAREAWLALQDAKAEGFLQRIDYIETTDTRDRAANLAAFADQGYDIVVTVGSGISDETLAAARQHPDLRFVRIQPPQDSAEEQANLVDLVFHEERAGFLAGAAAALTTRTGHVAAICESAFIDSSRRFCEGFRAGATHVAPAIRVVVEYRSGPEELLFRDVAWGRATARQQVDEGADVLFAVGERTATAALLEAARQGVWVIAAETDLYEQVPEIRSRLLTSAILEIRRGLLAVLRQVASGQTPTHQHWGEVDLAPWHEFEGRLPPGVPAKLEELGRDLITGDLVIDLPLGEP
jgi:basic membrane protein A